MGLSKRDLEWIMTAVMRRRNEAEIALAINPKNEGAKWVLGTADRCIKVLKQLIAQGGCHGKAT